MSDPGKPLSGQTALVTGANSGIGEAIAKELGARGARVVVNFVRGDEEENAVVNCIIAAGGEAMPAKADVSNPDDVAGMFQKAIDAWGTLDIVVTNAGVQIDSSFLKMDIAAWQKVIGINLTGQFLCAQAAARIFARQGVREGISKSAGKIICISSVHEVIPWAGHVNYATSKGGIHMMMQTIAQELAPSKIRVNAIAPGAIKTKINESVWSDPAKAQDLLKLIPYGRIGEPGDIARAAAWLASDESDYVTGTTLFVDGGMTLYPGFADNG